MIVIVMGVSGAGKTTVGSKLAAALGCAFVEGDTLHPDANVLKMSQGLPLTDEDRDPWLTAVRDRMRTFVERGEDAVIACSALKHAYRMRLAKDLPVVWVYLKGTAELMRSRLERRRGHFMRAEMLDSQLRTLEEPAGAFVADAALPPDVIVASVLAHLASLAARRT